MAVECVAGVDQCGDGSGLRDGDALHPGGVDPAVSATDGAGAGALCAPDAGLAGAVAVSELLWTLLQVVGWVAADDNQ